MARISNSAPPHSLAAEVAERARSSGAGCTTTPPGRPAASGVTMPVLHADRSGHHLERRAGEERLAVHARPAAACRGSPRAALGLAPRRSLSWIWTAGWGRSWGSSRTRGWRRSAGRWRRPSPCGRRAAWRATSCTSLRNVSVTLPVWSWSTNRSDSDRGSAGSWSARPARRCTTPRARWRRTLKLK